MEIVVSIFLVVMASYFMAGILFALYVVFVAASKIDPLLAQSKKKVRVLIFPGLVATWPFLLGKLFKSRPQ
ncbi:hypothetical protein L0P88_03170 [Muricauda sp. SCSIO 64092]|uniref:hypothetical protein n=1 Tax=Allomuricauda sp. SCSIO 64092 TaxID=2908842 RepID=UPI001FF2F2C4|nr:hypothetical protein [Muricauda sp. SCSIO 64092]UOY07563.1 hypothetical protein L0P88_03170 [Muricauda sp. SCSIO 64092]